MELNVYVSDNPLEGNIKLLGIRNATLVESRSTRATVQNIHGKSYTLQNLVTPHRLRGDQGVRLVKGWKEE